MVLRETVLPDQRFTLVLLGLEEFIILRDIAVQLRQLNETLKKGLNEPKSTETISK